MIAKIFVQAWMTLMILMLILLDYCISVLGTSDLCLCGTFFHHLVGVTLWIFLKLQLLGKKYNYLA